jgi:hypothetical protein
MASLGQYGAATNESAMFMIETVALYPHQRSLLKYAGYISIFDGAEKEKYHEMARKGAIKLHGSERELDRSSWSGSVYST